MSSINDSDNIQEIGASLLTAVNVALRSLRLYPEENDFVQQAIDDLHQQMGALLATEGAFELNISGDFFFPERSPFADGSVKLLHLRKRSGRAGES